MTHNPARTNNNPDVAIIGGGPAGLAAATTLKQRGIKNIIVLEREPDAGGIPRHCGHPPFGVREFKRLLKGPQYAAKLVAKAEKSGVEIRTSTTVIEAKQNGTLLLHDPTGMHEIHPRRVIYATGVRENPRSSRLLSGTRPLGVMNTGTLQSMVYIENLKPCSRPLIVGTELVSFSAIMTCRHAGIKPVAMIEGSPNVTAFWPSAIFPKLVGIPLHMNTKLLTIKGANRIEAALIEGPNGVQQEIECDAIILTGQFTPESALARCGHLQVDAGTGGPVVDQFGRCSDPIYFAAGNLLRPVETAGWSWNEGRNVGNWVADDLQGKLPELDSQISVIVNDPLIKFAMPQKLSISANGLASKTEGMKNLQLRFKTRAKGTLMVRQGEKVIYQKFMTVKPETRYLISLSKLKLSPQHGDVHLNFEEQ